MRPSTLRDTLAACSLTLVAQSLTPVVGLLLVVQGAMGAGLPDGQSLYETHCLSCHGADGKGEGPAAYLVYPKPRDFTTGVYRFRTTQSGSLPTDDDIARSIRVGIPGTAMPAFGDLLEEEQIKSLVMHVKAYCDEFQGESIQSDTTIPPQPPVTPDRIARGREVYEKLRCGACHGPDGKGDGPTASTMVDEKGFFIPPKDFTQGIFKGGNQPEDVYRSIVTGLTGTAMPSFRDLFDPSLKMFDFEDPAWSLVQYIKSLSDRQSISSKGAGAEIVVTPMEDSELFLDPRSTAWDPIPGVTITLRPLWTRNEFPARVEVKAARSGGRLALRMEWEDSTANVGAIGPDEFPDKVAAAFPLGDEIPFIGMGSRRVGEGGERGIVNVWCWRGDRSRQQITGHFDDVQDRYPRTSVDWYPFRKGWVIGESTDPAGDVTASHNPTFLTGWAAGNPVSDPVKPEGEVTEFDAVGFGTLTAQSPKEQNVTGRGHWGLGRWAVVLTRDLYSGGDGDVVFIGKEGVPVSFAVWDGQAGDRNGTKCVSNWHWLRLTQEDDN